MMHIKEQKNGLNSNKELIDESYIDIFDKVAKKK